MRLTILVEGKKVDELDLNSKTLRKNNDDRYQVIAHPEIKGRYRVSTYELFRIISLELKPEGGCHLELTSDQAGVEMFFLLEGKMISSFNSPEGAMEAESPSHNIYHNTRGKRKIKILSDRSKYMIIEISPRYFLEHLPGTPRFQEFRTSIMKHQPWFLYTGYESMTLDMRQLLHEIERFSPDCPFKCIHIKIKVLELLLHQFQNPLSEKSGPPELPESELEKISRAKSLVEANFTNPPALSELARQVGSNEFYLKKGFKTITGNTVYGYIQDLKMKKAIELLQEKKWTIQQIAEAVGYKYAQHFSTAFKKNFGMAPGKYKKEHF